MASSPNCPTPGLLQMQVRTTATSAPGQRKARKCRCPLLSKERGGGFPLQPLPMVPLSQALRQIDGQIIGRQMVRSGPLTTISEKARAPARTRDITRVRKRAVAKATAKEKGRNQRNKRVSEALPKEERKNWMERRPDQAPGGMTVGRSRGLQTKRLGKQIVGPPMRTQVGRRLLLNPGKLLRQSLPGQMKQNRPVQLPNKKGTVDGK
mmetsp:Transcript_40440/g.86821  ORF Transcript_40440/g.86821 Transcript_40440/m.86821 type:complete len:208 (-) Transcript_40440:235-858(-)